MKTISVTNQKGGVAKTTTSVQLAFYLAKKGYKVVLIDLDAQKNSSDILSAYNRLSISAFLKGNELVSEIGEVGALDVVYADTSLITIDKEDLYEVCHSFKEKLLSISERYDFCIIDTAPTLNQSVTMSLVASDYVIAPSHMDNLAFRGLEQLFSSISEANEYNPDLKLLAIVATMVNNHSPKQKQMFEKLLELYPDVVVAQKISLRTGVSDAISDKLPIWNVKSESGRKARTEFERAFELILAKLNK